MGILDLIFPKHCVSCKKLGFYVCASCFAKISFDVSDTCLICGKFAIEGITHPNCKTRFAIEGAFTSVAYSGVVRKLLYAFKYKPFLSDLEETLVDFFYEGLIQKETFMRILEKSQYTLLCPIPLYSLKLKKRGYNQAELLSMGLAKKLGLESKNLLKRVKETRSQFKLSKEERKENIKEAFEYVQQGSWRIQNVTIFLVDDLLTTGSTFVEAGKILKKAGAKEVWGIALARD